MYVLWRKDPLKRVHRSSRSPKALSGVFQHLRSWEWQEFLSKILSDHFNHQLQQLQEILGDRQLVDLSQVTGALHSWVTEHGDFQLALREMEQLRRGELQQNPSSPYAISIRNDLEGSPSNVPDRSVSAAAERESREILAAIRELQRNLDLSHEFSAVIAAVQEKDVKHTPVLVALQEQKTDINAQFDDLREMLRQAQIWILFGGFRGRSNCDNPSMSMVSPR